MKIQDADERDCLELANDLMETLEKSDGSWVYEGDDPLSQLIPVLKPVVGELLYLRSIISKLPHTADGWPITRGMVIYCPRGHANEVRPSDPMSGRVYCTRGNCWDDGCQGDSGSGTHYEAKDCYAVQIAVTLEEPPQ